MNKAEEYVEKEIAEFTVNTFDGQEDSTYKYIHIDIAKGIALEGVRIAREEGMRSKLNELIDKDTESFKLKWNDLERKVEVHVREEMINKFKSFLKNHEVMFFGCDCSDCQTMEDDFEEKFLIKTGVQKE